MSRRDLGVQLQGVRANSQISTPCYTAKQDSIVDEQDDREQSPPSPSVTDMEQPPDQEPLNIMVLTKEFDPDLEELGKDFTSEENKDKRLFLSYSSGRNGDFYITTITPLLSYIIFVYVGTFLIAQRTLLTLWHPRCTFIKFLWLHVPHVLQCDADPTVGDFIGTRAGIFPLVLLSDTNIA